MHRAFDQEKATCQGKDKSKDYIEDLEVLPVGIPIEVAALDQDDESEGATEPHRDKADMRHWDYIS